MIAFGVGWLRWISCLPCFPQSPERPYLPYSPTAQPGGRAIPLVAWQRYGTGKCMSIASDRLWRLRYRTGDKYHWRVWSQCIQFMTLSRLMGEHKRIRLETDRSTYPVDGPVPPVCSRFG